LLQDVRKSEHFNASTQGEGKNGPVDGLGTISGPSPTRIDDIVNGLFVGHAARVLADFPDTCIDCVITSPPYFGAVSYNGGGCPWPSYDAYLDDMQSVWRECGRVLRPNGKLCINAPIMHIPQKLIPQDTRHLKNIAVDMEARILAETGLRRFSCFIWQKQTSKAMFGSYPHPGNILENNTVEFILVFVKPGAPPKFTSEVKAGNELSSAEWIDLIQQVWFMYPADAKRQKGHPAPFPDKLPARLMRMYTMGAVGDFPGEVVLDPLMGSGTTCVIAKRMGRRYIGIDIDLGFVKVAKERITKAVVGDVPMLFVGRPKYPTKDELKLVAQAEAGSAGRKAESKHKRKTYGRSVAAGSSAPPPQAAAE
jgi:modification methylase